MTRVFCYAEADDHRVLYCKYLWAGSNGRTWHKLDRRRCIHWFVESPVRRVPHEPALRQVLSRASTIKLYHW